MLCASASRVGHYGAIQMLYYYIIITCVCITDCSVRPWSISVSCDQRNISASRSFARSVGISHSLRRRLYSITIAATQVTYTRACSVFGSPHNQLCKLDVGCSNIGLDVSVVCVSVCVMFTRVSPARMTELIKMPCGDRLEWAKGIMY